MSDFAVYGLDLFGNPVDPRRSLGPLAERYEFPPFSVLNAREGDWQDRKRAWAALGIQGELGRGDGTRTFGSGAPEDLAEGFKEKAATAVSQKLAPGGGGGGCWPASPATASTANFGKRLTWVQGDRPIDDLDEVSRKNLSAQPASGTSIFDPVLCELVYRWFCPDGGQILDPFAGGSVRGIVAGLLGYSYHGIDLRLEQIEANRKQRDEIAPDAPIVWAAGDSMTLLDEAPDADFVFSCPPYGDLERYSNDPADLSTMEYQTFLGAYKRIILRCAKKLKPNRLACFVVGDFRDKKTGMYRGFVADTINAFREVGLPLYNDAVLVTAVGSLPIRVSGQFESGRKLGKTHQNVLVFAKGDPRLAFAEPAEATTT